EITRVRLSEVALQARFKLEDDDLDCVRAADEGDIEAQCDLGLLLLSHGMETEACGWFQKAARHFHPEAMQWLGRCMISGWGTAPDREAGITWLRRAAARGHATAGHMVAWIDTHPGPAPEGAELEAVLDGIEQKVILGALRETAE
ncbi:tetratricopeptide repeat protein, partial [Thauera linaloolentis]|uniref:tetratricopeptide repeat protein n=1 Tax=Thauera linaloolentis TaxID=76112 RepID=UPI003D9C7017|nr:hypothetical protein [Thauera linaloolentis]